MNGNGLAGIEKYIEILSLMDDYTECYMFVYDLTNDYYTISKKALNRFKLNECTFANASNELSKVVYEADYPMLSKNLSGLMDGSCEVHDLEYRWLDKEGKPVWISCKGKVVYDEDVRCKYMFGSISELGKSGKYDNITSLHREGMLEEYYKYRSDTDKMSGYMLIIGIDNFKQINEKCGYEIGNMVLADVAKCIINCVGTEKNVYRLHGDEFVVVNECDVDSALDCAKKMYKQIRYTIDKYIECQNYHLFYTISGGAYAFNTDKDKYVDIMNNLKFALNSAKLKGRNTFVGYSKESYDEHIRRINIQDELRNCISNDFEGFEVFYQPVAKVDSNHEIRGAEALIRWNSKVYGAMSPVEFVPLLEESSLIIPLGKWVIEQAVNQCKKWLEVIPDFTMNINLSFVQIIKSDIMKDVLACVDYHGIDHEHIVFEATESGDLESNSAVKNVLKSFNDESFRLAIDDFGTGYSNLKYIRDMMFSIIKIDRLFIQNIDKSEDNYILVKYIIGMAHSLGIRVCVEGVETKEELETVMKLKPDCIQGFYYGKPMTSSQFAEKFVNK